eukprot:scaffold240171_cov36-Cyclotella_meneghiniana.AAC.1
MLHMEQSNAAAMITHHDVDGVRKIQIHCQWFHFYDAGDEVQIMMMKCDDGRTNSQRQLLWHLQKTQPLSACGQGMIAAHLQFGASECRIWLRLAVLVTERSAAV